MAKSRQHTQIIQRTTKGLYCPAGDFYIDPWQPVEKAVITHAHSDHARSGHSEYFALSSGEPILRHRLGQNIQLNTLAPQETFTFTHKKGSRAKISLHPAGHVLGSAQVRIEVDGAVWVVTGDYKRDPDPTCQPFEPIPCHTFITEATFALPIFRWPNTQEVVKAIYQWWQENKRQGQASVLFCYAFGKAQRILAELLRHTNEVVWLHGAVDSLTTLYRAQGVEMVPTQKVPTERVSAKEKHAAGEALIIAPPSAMGSAWMKRFGNCSTGFCSGWMAIRGNRRRRGYDRGFVLSDHADWPSLLKTIEETGAKHIRATHGRTDILVRYLQKQGLDATALETPYGEEEKEASA